MRVRHRPHLSGAAERVPASEVASVAIGLIEQCKALRIVGRRQAAQYDQLCPLKADVGESIA